MKLTDKQIKSLEIKDKQYKLSDGDGLSILVKPNGSKYFIYRFYFNKKTKEIHLGTYPALSLKSARLERNKCKELIASGLNPIEQKKKLQLDTDTKNSTLFINVAADWLALKKLSWSEGYYEDVTSRLSRLVYPKIGMSPMDDIDPAYLYKVLISIQKDNSILLGHNCKSYISQIYSYGITLNKAKRNPASDFTGLLQPKQIRHYPSITEPTELRKYLLKADNFSGSIIVKTALDLLPLVFCRPGELRKIEWNHINWELSRIDLPAIIMKMKEDHIIPLSTQAIDILSNLYHSYERNKRSPYVFHSPRAGNTNCISENTLSKALRSLGYTKEEVVPHGFRATARTLLDEVLEYPIVIIEQQLAHTVKDIHGRAYNRTKHIKQRSEMMQAWSDYLYQLKE